MNTAQTKKTSIAALSAASIINTANITGGCDCTCPTEKSKGNNGIGNGIDPAPPGLVKNGRGDFNDRDGNRHTV